MDISNHFQTSHLVKLVNWIKRYFPKGKKCIYIIYFESILKTNSLTFYDYLLILSRMYKNNIKIVLGYIRIILKIKYCLVCAISNLRKLKIANHSIFFYYSKPAQQQKDKKIYRYKNEISSKSGKCENAGPYKGVLRDTSPWDKIFLRWFFINFNTVIFTPLLFDQYV